MSAVQIQEQEQVLTEQKAVVNDFSITVGTVNGSGSQTSNLTILRSLFRMGIPVSGKNLFPSNIQGLPTWYTIRVNKDGYLARREEQEIMVAMNQATFTQDLKAVISGGAFFYSDDIKLPVIRDDIAVYPMAVKQLVREVNVPAALRDYIANMVYVGVLSQIIGIDLDKIFQALNFHFKGKTKPVDMNFEIVRNSFDWAKANLAKQDPYLVEPMKATEGFIMADGNTAAAIGAIYGGLHFAAWYPITPATSLAESLLEYLPILRKDPLQPSRNTYVVLQAEDELAAIGMSIGAGWAGLRSMTSTSGPGLSLMAEYAGLAYYAEVPVVIWDIQRVGPSTGLPTRTAQGDLTFAHFMGHGDSQHVILLPGSVDECFEFGWKALDLAERLQAPVLVLSDLDLGMNQWMTNPFKYPDTSIDRGKVLWESDIEKMRGEWARYREIDGDGITYRTIPGNRDPNAAYFTRGTGHSEDARYSEDPVVWHEGLERLKRKFETAKKYVPGPVIEKSDGSEIGFIAFGSTDAAIQEARDMLAEKGVQTGYLRVRAIPFSADIEEFIQSYERIYVTEMNRDGQLFQLLVVYFPQLAGKLNSIAYTDGLPLTAKFVYDALASKEDF